MFQNQFKRKLFLNILIFRYLRDVLDHLGTCIEKLSVVRESLNHTLGNYMNKISVEIAQSTRKTDAFMNRMSAIAAIFTPMSVV